MKHINFCHVYRRGHGENDSTNNGITSRLDIVTVITDVPFKMKTAFGKEYLDGPDEAAVEEYVRRRGLDPAKVLLLCDKTDNPIYTPYLKPLDSVFKGKGRLGPMFGGNYVGIDYHTLVRVHDRYETQEEYNMLSA